jgi:hypothetical protein
LCVIKKACRMTRRELFRREELHWKVVGNDHVLVLWSSMVYGFQRVGLGPWRGMKKISHAKARESKWSFSVSIQPVTFQKPFKCFICMTS